MLGRALAAARSSGATVEVVDPGLRAAFAVVPDMSLEEIREEISIAESSKREMAESLAKTRSVWLSSIAQAHRENLDELSDVLSKESGKPIAEARGEVLYGASYFDWYAGEARRISGSVVPAPTPSRTVTVTYEPVGTCALITPFNFPNAMLARKLSAAVAAGCPAVCKPSHDVPLSALLLQRMCVEAGVPESAVRVVTTSRESASIAGREFCSNPSVRKISFTGSTPVGAKLIADSAPLIKRVSMELGGNAPFIVFEDADLEQALDGFFATKYRNAGQTCISPNRMYVQQGVFEEFVAALTARVDALSVGYRDFDVGPLIDDRACSKVDRLLNDALESGGVLRTSSSSSSGVPLGYCAPSVVAMPQDSRPALLNEEIFGPLTAVFPFSDESEVVHKANDTDAGLASYFFSTDFGRVERVSRQLKYGMVGVNTGVISTEVAPFGGVKTSGLGREGGTLGLMDYLDVKYRAACF